jgi:hypothetical protein
MPIEKITSRTTPRQPRLSPLEPLGPDHRSYLAAAVADIVPDWTVDLHAEGRADATITIMPEDGDDDLGPTLFVHCDGDTFHLDQLHGDAFSNLGAFGALSDVAHVLRGRLGCLRLLLMPVSRTLH